MASAKRRSDGRAPGEMRALSIEPGFMPEAEGSALIQLGGTRVICTASIEAGVPPFLRDTGRGWVTAEYSMLPRSTHKRTIRESVRGRPDGRTQEIQRIVGRSLRAVTDLSGFGERTVWVDCDVIGADGGTRTASVTGGFVALALAFAHLHRDGLIDKLPLRDFVAAVSAGRVGGQPLLDLCYKEDSRAEVDLNVVMTGAGKLVEVQGTAEGEPFSEDELLELERLAASGIQRLVEAQRHALGPAAKLIGRSPGRGKSRARGAAA